MLVAARQQPIQSPPASTELQDIELANVSQRLCERI
jgi:hypothetical protein